MIQRFQGGSVVATPQSLAWLARSGVRAGVLLDRHFAGDWGELDQDDVAFNERGLESGRTMLLSRYVVNGVPLYVKTEADRSVTTVLLASEY